MSTTSSEALLRVEDLTVRAGARVLLRPLSLALQAGEALVLLGESGAGKSLLAQAIMGTLPPGLQASGQVVIEGRASAADRPAQRQPLWGHRLAMLPQEPAQALDPLMRLQPQLALVHRHLRGAAPAEAAARAEAALASAGLGAAAQQFPWQVSGGMAQRAAAAIALAGGARLLLVDEPTKGLDAHWRDRCVELLQQLRREGGAVLVITHDLQVARALGGRMMVLREGECVEQGDTARVLAAPAHAFTRALIAADPSGWPDARLPTRAPAGEPVVRAEALGKQFGGRWLFDGLDLAIGRGERLAVQGPSGCGKSTLGNLLLGLLAPDRGRVRRAADLRPWALQKLYQDPQGSFAPTVTLADALGDVGRRHRLDAAVLRRLLEALQIDAGLLARRPAQVSGGELQRLALARVLWTGPALLFADEPTSRLDPLTQQQALALLARETARLDCALLLVTHDVDVARAMAPHTLRPARAATPAACAAPV